MLEFNDVGYLERKNDYKVLTLAYRDARPVVATRETSTALQINVREPRRPDLWSEVKLVAHSDAHQLLVVLLDLHLRGPSSTIARPVTERRWSAAAAGCLGEIGSDPRRPLTVWPVASSTLKQAGGIIFGVNAQSRCARCRGWSWH